VPLYAPQIEPQLSLSVVVYDIACHSSLVDGMFFWYPQYQVPTDLIVTFLDTSDRWRDGVFTNLTAMHRIH
jgi:hypothetical protein